MSQNKTSHETYKVIVAGVGGQGAITLAQLILGAAHHNGYNALQSEVHGMSQRGGAVNAHVVFSAKPVYSPVVMEGDGDLLLALEPLETLRYLPNLKKNAKIIVGMEPIVNMDNYPAMTELKAALSALEGVQLIDVEEQARTIGNRRGGNMVLLGAAAGHMPISKEVWHQAISERFDSKGADVVAKNIEAFGLGLKL
jgi:indolepyruvate ferredoxin oxidoreductase beta subunit